MFQAMQGFFKDSQGHEGPPFSNPRLFIRSIVLNRHVTIIDTTIKLLFTKIRDGPIGMHIGQELPVGPIGSTGDTGHEIDPIRVQRPGRIKVTLVEFGIGLFFELFRLLQRLLNSFVIQYHRSTFSVILGQGFHGFHVVRKGIVPPLQGINGRLIPQVVTTVHVIGHGIIQIIDRVIEREFATTSSFFEYFVLGYRFSRIALGYHTTATSIVVATDTGIGIE
mmetsp:Transcript_735/g.1449  ORF Transcript_735/g.1449 Transcript_735/m.1449 type:complete len:222 (-) Transcript_735:958-1623(-)